MKMILPNTSDSALHQKIKQEVVKTLGEKLDLSDDPDKLVKDYLTEIIRDYDKLSQDLEHEKIFEQVKILNIIITRGSVLSFFVAFASAVFTIYQLLFPSG